jgi:hypothetical protein
LIEKEVASVVFHASVEALPETTEVGLAMRVHVGGGGGVTVTVAVQCTVPPVPEAVSVYVVVVESETDFEPEAATLPTPLLIDTEVAFSVVQESVEESPAVIEVGEAVRVQVGAGGVGVTVIVAVQWTVPPAPTAVPV